MRVPRLPPFPPEIRQCSSTAQHERRDQSLSPIPSRGTIAWCRRREAKRTSGVTNPFSAVVVSSCPVRPFVGHFVQHPFHCRLTVHPSLASDVPRGPRRGYMAKKCCPSPSGNETGSEEAAVAAAPAEESLDGVRLVGSAFPSLPPPTSTLYHKAGQVLSTTRRKIISTDFPVSERRREKKIAFIRLE